MLGLSAQSSAYGMHLATLFHGGGLQAEGIVLVVVIIIVTLIIVLLQAAVFACM